MIAGSGRSIQENHFRKLGSVVEMTERRNRLRLLLRLVWRARRLISWPPAPIHVLLMAVVVLVHSLISSRESSLSASERSWLEYERLGSPSVSSRCTVLLTGTLLTRCCSHRRTVHQLVHHRAHCLLLGSWYTIARTACFWAAGTPSRALLAFGHMCGLPSQFNHTDADRALSHTCAPLFYRPTHLSRTLTRRGSLTRHSHPHCTLSLTVL